MRKSYISTIALLVSFTFSMTGFASTAEPAKRVIVLKASRPLQSQMIYNNARYIIRRRIDLRGETIIVPPDSELAFQKKGVFRNGVLIGDYTGIDAAKRHIFDNIEIDRRGTWRNNNSYPEWFGARNKKTFDSKNAIQKAIDIADTCILSQSYYTAYDTKTKRWDDVSFCAIEILPNKCLRGMPGSTIFVDAKFSDTERTTVFYVKDNVSIDGVNIVFFNEDHTGWTGTQAGVYRIDGGNVKIQNTSLTGAMAAWVNIIGMPGRSGFIIRNNYVRDCDCGVIVQGNQHKGGEIYSINMSIENNIIEKEKEPHSEFVAFWGSCSDGGRVYYSDIVIHGNQFRGGTQGGCITSHPERTGIKNLIVSDNEFYDCGRCSFYNVENLVYCRNYVTGSSFVERQVKGDFGSYPDLAFVSCSNCLVDDNSCFGIVVENCRDLRIGKLKQTLCLKPGDTFFEQNPDFITNFIGVKAINSTVTIDELYVNPFSDEDIIEERCRYFIKKIQNSRVRINKMVSNIPVIVATEGLSIGKKEFKGGGDPERLYIEIMK